MTTSKITYLNIHRHLIISTISAATIWWFVTLRSEWTPVMHQYNKSFGDVSLILVALILFLGAVNRLFPSFKKPLFWRREMGIWAIIFALIHVYVIFDGWTGWELKRLFGYRFYEPTGRWIFAYPGFALANMVGLIALFYGVALLFTSNQLSVRLLTRPAWKHLHQRAAHALYLLTTIHTAYFLYLYYTPYPKSPPPPNFFQLLFPLLIILLSITQGAAFSKTVFTAGQHKKGG